MKTVSLAIGAVLACTGAANANESFDAEVRAALLRNPEIILEVFAVLEAKNEAREVQKDAQTLSDLDHLLFADVDEIHSTDMPVLIEFVDYNCGYCRRAEAEIAAVLETNENIVFKVLQFPILGETSVEAARIAYAAKLLHGDEAYLRINKALLEGGAPAMQNLDRFLETMGFDAQKLRETTSDPRIDEHLTTTHELARRLGIAGTPGFVTRTRIHRGFVSANELSNSALRTVTADGMNQ